LIETLIIAVSFVEKIIILFMNNFGLLEKII
jgi:hypothetical protein